MEELNLPILQKCQFGQMATIVAHKNSLKTQKPCTNAYCQVINPPYRFPYAYGETMTNMSAIGPINHMLTGTYCHHPGQEIPHFLRFALLETVMWMFSQSSSTQRGAHMQLPSFTGAYKLLQASQLYSGSRGDFTDAK